MMLDLKKQLLQAGLVTEKQVEKVEQEEAEARERKKKAREARKARGPGGPGGKGGKGGRPRGKGPGGKGRGGKGPGGKGRGKGPGPNGKADRPDDKTLWARRIEKLAQEGRTEQYEVIRKWVDKTRLDPASGLPSEQAERFFFEKGDNQVGWLTVEPELAEKLKAGQAGVITYVGFNGLNHCAVPRDVAIDVHQVRPEFLRALADYEFEKLPILTGKDRRKKERADKGPAEGEGAEAAAGEQPTGDGAPTSATPPEDGKTEQPPVDAAPVDGTDPAPAQSEAADEVQTGPESSITQPPPDPSAPSQ